MKHAGLVATRGELCSSGNWASRSARRGAEGPEGRRRPVRMYGRWNARLAAEECRRAGVWRLWPWLGMVWRRRITAIWIDLSEDGVVLTLMDFLRAGVLQRGRRNGDKVRKERRQEGRIDERRYDTIALALLGLPLPLPAALPCLSPPTLCALTSDDAALLGCRPASCSWSFPGRKTPSLRGCVLGQHNTHTHACAPRGPSAVRAVRAYGPPGILSACVCVPVGVSCPRVARPPRRQTRAAPRGPACLPLLLCDCACLSAFASGGWPVGLRPTRPRYVFRVLQGARALARGSLARSLVRTTRTINNNSKTSTAPAAAKGRHTRRHARTRPRLPSRRRRRSEPPSMRQARRSLVSPARRGRSAIGGWQRLQSAGVCQVTPLRRTRSELETRTDVATGYLQSSSTHGTMRCGTEYLTAWQKFVGVRQTRRTPQPKERVMFSIIRRGPAS